MVHSTTLGMDHYHNSLAELEQLVMQMGPTIVIDDFNAHLGSLGGPRGNRSPQLPRIPPSESPLSPLMLQNLVGPTLIGLMLNHWYLRGVKTLYSSTTTMHFL